MADGKIVIETDLDNKGIKDGLAKLGSVAKTGIQTTVKAIGAAGTALAGLGAAAVKVGSDFETSLAKASTLFGDVQVDTKGLSQKILELSDSSGVAASSIGNSLYNALSAGIPATEDMGSAMTYMQDCTKLAKAGFTDVDTVVTATAKVLNAYKMDVSKTGDVHKVLMQVQNKGITTVAELGSVLAQVTPIAAAMNVSFEQVGASLASMTAQGTPTAQATTMLNTMFAELGKQGTIASKNLEKAAQGTEYAGKSFSELMKEGVPLNKVLDVMQQYADKNNLSMIDMFGSIEAGKSALALSGKNSEQFTSNLAAMATQSDVVGEAYEKVSNTLQENTKKMGNSFKNLGISIYQDVDSPLANVSKTALGMVQDLSKAFQSGGFEGLVTTLGDVLARAVSEIANAAPKFIDAAVNLISSFLAGIGQTANKIADAAVEIGKSLINGLIKIIPQIAQVGVDFIAALASSILGSDIGSSIASIGSSIIKAFQSILQAVTTVVDTLKPILSGIITVITKVADAVIGTLCKAITFLADNIKMVLPLITGVATAFVAWKIIQTVTKSMQAAKTAILAFNAAETLLEKQTLISTGAISAKQVIVGVLTGKIKLATLAEMAWNAVKLINPWVGIGVAVAAVVGGIVGLIACLSDEDKEHKKLMETLDKEKKARKEAYEEQQKSLETDLTEINQVDSLNKELKTLVDSNGKVKEGYEKRANYIMTELNKACDTEMTMVGNVMIGYGKLTDQLYAVTDQSKSWNDELKTLVDSNGKIKQGEEERAKVLTEKLNDSMKTNFKITGDTITNYGELSASIDTQIGKNKSLVDELGSLVDENGKVKKGQEDRVQFILKALKDATGIEIQLNNGVIDSYKGIQTEIDKTIAKKKAAIVVESYDEIYKNALGNYNKNLSALRKYGDEKAALEIKINQATDERTKTQIRQELKKAQEGYDKSLEAVKNNQHDIAFVEDLQTKQASGTQEDLAAILAQGAANYDDNGKLIVESLNDRLQNEKKSLEMYQEARKNATTKADQDMYDAQIKSSEANIKIIQDEMQAKTSTVTDGTQAMLGKQIELIDSNGVKFQTSFEELMKNAETGVKNGGVPVDLAMQDNMSSIISTITNSGVPIEQQTTALADLQTKVFKDNVNNVSDAEKANMQAVLDSINTTNPDMAKAVEALVNTGVLEIKDGKVEFSKKAKEMGLDGSEAIKQTREDYNQAAQWALGGVIVGINAKIEDAKSTVEMASATLATVFRETLDINSPSKVFAKIAQSIPEGIAVGVESNKKEALNAVEQLADETATKAKREFEQLDLSNSIPDQEIKVTGILEKIKNLNASELVQRIRAEVMASQERAGMAFAARVNTSNSGIINNITKQPIINFNQPVESPDTTARAVNRVLTFGLAGDRN